jgi:glycosyltransferase involved in cell wall biosynthesis
MHLLFLSSEFPPTPGGIATYLGHATRMLSRAGHRVTIFTLGGSPGDAPSSQALADQVQIIRLAPHRTRAAPNIYHTLSHWPSLSYQFAEAIAAYLTDSGERPDVIEAQDNGALAYYLLQRRLVDATPLSGIPLLVHLHWPEIENARNNRLGQYRFPDYWVGRLERFCFNAADALLSPSHFLREQILAQGYTRQPIDVIPLPVHDPSTPSTFPCGTPQPGDIVSVGRLEYRKGMERLIEACAALWSKGLDFRLTIIGNEKPPYEYYGRPFTAFVEEKYGVYVRRGQLVMQAPLPQAQLFQRLSTAWAVVIPSLADNFPYTCCEAMLASKVVLASTSGGQAEMIGTDGQNGFLFDWARPETFEQALQAVLNLSVADNQATGAAAHRRITALTSYEAVLPQRIEHYHKVIKQAASRRGRRLFPSVNWDEEPAAAIAASASPNLDDAHQLRLRGRSRHTGCARADADLEHGLETGSQPGSSGASGLLSVIIPFYNMGEYVAEALNSILASTYRPLEILIIDDGSTDEASLREIDRLREQNLAGLRIIRTRNQGLARTRNLGAREAHGEFLAFVDADDMVLPDFFARAVTVLQAYDNVGFVYSWVQFFGAKTDWWPTWNTEFPFLLGHNMLTPLAVTCRDLFLQHAQNRPELVYGYEDWDSWIRLAAAGYLGVSLPHLLVKYRVRRNSMQRRINARQALYLQDVIAQGSPEVYRQYAIELLNLVNTNGPSLQWWYPTMQTDPYNRLKGRFFSLASRPGFNWLLRLPLRDLYRRLRR